MGVTRTVREVVHVVRDRELTFMAAAIAHYMLASIVPLLLLGVALASLFGSEAVIESVVRNRLADVLSSPVRELVVAALTSVSGAVGASLVSVAFALWSGSKVFRGLSVAFAELYDARTSASLPRQLLEAAVVMGLLALVVAALVVSGVVVSIVTLPTAYPVLVGTGILLVALVLGLLPIYYVLTPVPASVREILPGTLLATVGLVVLQVGLVYYGRHAGRYAALGALGALLLFVTWLYLGSIVVLVGGAMNYVLGHGSG